MAGTYIVGEISNTKLASNSESYILKITVTLTGK